MAAGLSIFSYQQRHDINGKPYPGLKYSFYAADSSDPIDTYREPSLAAKHPNPVVADGFGVSPGIFISDEILYYRVRVTTAAGVILDDDMLVANLVPTTGEGDPPTPIEATAVFKTGDLKHRFDEGIHEGWLNCNGRTFGSSTSGADYASDESESLFLHLWAKNSGASVVGGAGANAAADWAADKQMALPDLKGRVLAGLDDMDDDAGGVLSGLDTLGETMGVQSADLTAAEIPQLTGSTNTTGAHTHTIASTTDSLGESTGQVERADAQQPANVTTSSNGDHSHTVTVGNANPDPVSRVQPTMGVSIYIKL